LLRTRLPRYSQIAGALRERILGGALAPGTRLDNQRRLARQFGVTLMTLRQALTVLEREKLIARRHGLGTFVAAPSVDYDILQLRRLAQDLTALGEPVATRFVSSRFVRADRRVAEALALDGRGRVFVLERLRLLDQHPIGLQRSFLPAMVGEEVAKADLSVTPLHQILEFKLGLMIARATETISTIRLGRREARELGCRSGLPAFASERTSYAVDRAPVVFDRVFIPGDRFRITRELRWEGPSRTAEAPSGMARP
jgi:DNA-binding GntR family transcriptional regulator